MLRHEFMPIEFCAAVLCCSNTVLSLMALIKLISKSYPYIKLKIY